MLPTSGSLAGASGLCDGPLAGASGLCPAVARSILHLDADAFFASVEQRDDPRLRGRPVAVGTGVVASCSYEARRWGVRTGMRLAEARCLCRELVVVPGDYRRYEQAGRCMLAICLEQSPLVEMAALDDLYLDLTPTRSASEETATILRSKIREEMGLSVSAGVGGNKLVAQVATQQAKPGGQVQVPIGGERDFLAPWPASVLPGVGPKVAARLERLNVLRVADVAAMPVAVLCGLFGKQGQKLHQLAHGIDPRPVQPYRPPQSVSRRTSFEPPTADREFLRAMLDHLVDRACTWLRFNDLGTKGLAVTIHYGDYATANGRASFRKPVDDERELKEAARARLDRLYQRRLPLRLLGVELAPLGTPDRQPSLFPDPDAERAARLTECKDAIRKRFGFMALVNGSALVLADRLEQDRDNFRLRTPCLTR
jgi:DNA polymerase-4